MNYFRAMLIAFLMPFATAHAALVTIASPFGPDTAILDTDSGLEWLKFSATRNLSVNQVFAEMKPGGTLQSFHYATGSEFRCLIFGGSQIGCGSGLPFNNVPAVQAFFELFGVRLLPDEGFGTFYQVDLPGSNDPLQAFVASFVYYTEPSPNIYFDSQQIPLTRQIPNEPALHWLVREEQMVPEPSTVALFGISVIGLVSLRKKVFNRRVTIQR